MALVGEQGRSGAARMTLPTVPSWAAEPHDKRSDG